MFKKGCIKSSVLIAVFLFVFVGCGTTRHYIFESKPQGAEVAIDETNKGKTPFEVLLQFESEKKSYEIKVDKDGYSPKSFLLTKEYNGEFRVKGDDEKILLRIPLDPITKALVVESDPSNAKILVNNVYVDKTPAKVWLTFGDRSENIIKISKLGYKDSVKRIKPDYRLESLFVKLEEKPTRKMAYIMSDIEDSKIKFKLTYEEAYKDTIEKSPNALQVNRVMQTEDINVLVGRIDAYRDYLVFAKIFPKHQVNTDDYILSIESLVRTLKALQTIYNFSGMKLKPSDVTDLTELTSGILNDDSLSKVLPEKISSHMLSIVAEIKAEKSPDNYLDHLAELIRFISEKLNKLTMFESSEFYSEIWAVNLRENFKKTKITFTDGKWIDNAPSMFGTKIYFASNRNSNIFDIWRVDIGGGRGITKITNSPYSQDMLPSINEDGTMLSYSSLPLGAKDHQIWTINSDGTLPSQLKTGEPHSICSSSIALVSKRKQNNKSQIWLINTDGSQETLLSLNTKVNEMEPSFSPDCKWLVFTSDESGNKDIWMMSVDGSSRTQLTTNPSTDIHPVWGEDGYVYFVSNRGLLWGVWRLKPKIIKVEGLEEGSYADPYNMPR